MTDVNHSYQVARTIRRARYEQNFATEQNYHYTVNRTGGEYTFAFGDGTSSAVYDGRISLLKNGAVIQTLQALPDPTNHQNMLMSVDSLGRLFYENAGAHTAAHGNTGSGSGDGLIGSLDFLSSSGHIRAITTTGVTLTTPQSLDDRYYTQTEVDALIATLNGYITTLNASIGANATYAQGLNSRLVAVEGAMPTFKFAGGTAQPLLQLQVKSGDFPGTAYYNTHGILKIATSTPPDANPY